MNHELILLLLLILILIPPVIEDVRTKQIRNIYFLILIIIKSIYLLVIRDIKEVGSSFVSLFAALLIFGICHLISKNGIGLGDVKLLSGVAYYLGFELFLRDLLLISIGSLLFSIFLLATKQADKKYEVPLCPFILAGTCVATLFEVVI